ncbi:MAG TPA: hypothetical protein ENK06_12475 [Gammaproteobacteria bacterium]|nr:hypothetical protein [Gammaproteobacteria bacterium]
MRSLSENWIEMNRHKIQFVCILLFSFLLAVSASAEVFTANTFNDENDKFLGDGECLSKAGNCSLRAAIQESNALAGSHTIVLSRGTYYLTLEGRDENDAASGDLDIKANISITGAGATNTFINADDPLDGKEAGGIDRVFDINATRVRIENLSITRGKILTKDNPDFIGGIGGGIRILNSTLNLNNVWVYGNTAGAGLGGGIFSVNSTLNIEHSVIHLNYAAIGTGIASLNSITTINNAFFHGVAGGLNQSYVGGAIYNWGELSITKSVFYQHGVRLDGGAIYHERGKLRIINSTFNGNRAERNGGAIYYRMGEIDNVEAIDKAPVLKNVTIAYNHAYNLDAAYPDVEKILQQLRKLDMSQLASMSSDGSAIFTPKTQTALPTDTNNSQTLNGGGGLVVAGQDESQRNVTFRMVNTIVANNTYDKVVSETFNLTDTLLGDCATNSKADIISLGGNVDSSESCNFVEPADLGTIKPEDLQFGPMSANGKIFEDNINYVSLLKQNEFNNLKPQVQLFSQTSPIRNAAIAVYCPDTDQLGHTREDCDIGAYEYAPPPARSLQYVATPGEKISGIFALPSSAMNDAVTYHVVTNPPASKGVFFHPDISSPRWTFLVDSEATGSAEMTYQTCYLAIGECSNKVAKIVVKIVTETEESVVISATAETDIRELSTVTIINEAELVSGLSDNQYSFPLGAMFFSVSSVPTDEAITVKLQLPQDSDLFKNSNNSLSELVIRKLDNSGIWRSLPEVPLPGQSSGTYDQANKIITLRLIDNDIFDSYPESGAINDPVALAFPETTQSDQKGTQSSGINGAGSSLNPLAYLFIVFVLGGQRIISTRHKPRLPCQY